MQIYKFLERTSTGIAVASGLLTAACISGMPTASCTALAETYGRAIVGFGTTALLGLFIVGIGIISPPALSYFRERKKQMRSRVGRINLLFQPQTWLYAIAPTLVVASTLLFAGSSLSASDNLKTAIEHCYFGTDAELAHRLHERIALTGPFDWLGLGPFISAKVGGGTTQQLVPSAK